MSKMIPTSTRICSLLLWVLIISGLVEATNIGIFKDKTCSKSADNYRGPNGYPDGTCTALHVGSNSSFSVVDIDKGCAVTIYGPDDDPAFPCSSKLKIIAQHTKCYNSTWVYYSIDGCDIPVSTPSAIPAPATSTPSPAISPSTTNTNTSLIIGGIIGGVSIFAVLLITTMLLLRRHSRAQSQRRPLPPLPSHELSEDGQIKELMYPRRPAAAKIELYAHVAAAEMGRNSVYFPPAELPGDTLGGEDKKGLGAVVKIGVAR